MALSAKLQQKQTQSLVMTPQLLQSIRLLQYGNQELAAYIAREVEKNPLLEVIEETGEMRTEPAAMFDSAGAAGNNAEFQDGSKGRPLEAEAATGPGPAYAGATGADPWKSLSGAVSLDGGSGIEAFCAAAPSLQGHLLSQLPLALRQQADLAIAREIIESLDDDGYMRRPLSEIAAAGKISAQRVEDMLAVVQTLEPAGVGARSLSECLSIQLRDRNRLDPAMAEMLHNLHLLAKHDYEGLGRICRVSKDDILEMAEEIRNLDPRPGSRFSQQPVHVAIPDILVNERAGGGWSIELNGSSLPKVLVNREYYALVSKNCRSEDEKSFVVDCLQSANWLVKSLDQRAQTILKVATEIVRQQDGFLVSGIEHLKPLTLRIVADAISMHESTVSRVTSGKYMMTNRGLFELKYFFTPPIASTLGTENHSAEAVRYRIRQMIDAERPEKVLSDDTIVKALNRAGIDIARRTVAKYRESMAIPSSVQRRREKRALQSRRAG